MPPSASARPPRQCAHCGSPFTPRLSGPVATYCSGTCKAAACNTRAKVDGRFYEWAAASRERQRKPAIAHVCPYCESSFESPRADRAHCGATICRRRHAAKAQRDINARHRERFGESYTAKYNRSEHARERERRRNAEMPARQRYAASSEANDARRRARLKEQAVESFPKSEVFDRDGWICQICGRPVDPKVRWPAPLSPSLDHIVPLSKGGEHSRANTRCTHLACNLSKGASVEK